METKRIKISDTKNINDEELKEAAQILRDGGLVAFPTETVYGLGGNALDEKAAGKIYAAKGRPSDNPLIAHVSCAAEVTPLVKYIPEAGKKLMDAFWPGPLTIIFPKSDIVPYGTTGGLDTVAVRMPVDPVANRLIALAGVPVAAPSANTSGRPSPTTADHVWQDLNGKIEMIIDGGPVGIGVESTIVDVSGDVPAVLRPGAITMEMLKDVLGEVTIDPAILGPMAAGVRPKAPGMKYKHYAPKVDMILIEGDNEKMSSSIKEILHKYENEGKKVGLLVSDEVANELNHQNTFSYGSQENLAQIASEIYEGLRYFDDKDVDIILAQGTTDKGIGLAIMNRLHKASGFNSIFI